MYFFDMSTQEGGGGGEFELVTSTSLKCMSFMSKKKKCMSFIYDAFNALVKKTKNSQILSLFFFSSLAFYLYLNVIL
jgi:hypothetical protein